MCKNGVLDVRCMVYDDAIWILNDFQIEIGDFRNFLGGHRKVFVETRMEVLEAVEDGVVTQEGTCGVSNYYNVIGGIFMKGLESMVYDIIDED